MAAEGYPPKWQSVYQRDSAAALKVGSHNRHNMIFAEQCKERTKLNVRPGLLLDGFLRNSYYQPRAATLKTEIQT